jgi:membrane associated rhomboid family serine protease
MSVTEDLKNVFTRNGNGMVRILFITVTFFILENIVDELLRMSGNGFSLFYLLALPGNAFQALTQPWTLLTYMFLHQGLFHILFNMLWLYFIGKIFLEYAGSKRLVALYFMGGISGALLYLVTTLLFPLNWPIMVGASAGVMAVVIATAVLLPDYMIHLMFFGAVRLKYVALASFILTSLLDISQNTGGKISHIGGALFGMVFMLQYKRGRDLTRPVVALIENIQSLFSARSKIRVTYRKKASDEEYNANKKAQQEKMDAILDKISRSGYPSLTKEEKDFLFKVSGK